MQSSSIVQCAHELLLQELDYYMTDVGVDGFVTDYPATASTTINCKRLDPEGTLNPIFVPKTCPASGFAASN